MASGHQDTGARCLVAHHDAPDGRIGLPCIKCICGEWVRPDRWWGHKMQTRITDPVTAPPTTSEAP